MIPLTQLIAGAQPDSGVLGAIADATGRPRRRAHPRRRGAIAVLFVGKSVAALCSAGGCSAEPLALGRRRGRGMFRRYVLAPYADHRTRRLSEIYRNVNDQHGAGFIACCLRDRHVHRRDDARRDRVGACDHRPARHAPLGRIFGGVRGRPPTHLPSQASRCSARRWPAAARGLAVPACPASTASARPGSHRAQRVRRRIPSARLRGANAGRTIGISSDHPVTARRSVSS